MKQTIEGERLLDTSDLASMLRLSEHTLNKWRGVGRGPAFLKLGGRVLYEPGALKAWLDAQRKRSTSHG